MTSPETCSTCGAPMLWAITVYGNRQPIDPEPVPDGNLILRYPPAFSERTEPDVIHVGKPSEAEATLFDEYEGRRHKAHHATCPQGREWRMR